MGAFVEGEVNQGDYYFSIRVKILYEKSEKLFFEWILMDIRPSASSSIRIVDRVTFSYLVYDDERR